MLFQEVERTILTTTPKNGSSPLGIALASATRREFQVTLDPEAAQYLLDHMHERQRSLSVADVALHIERMRKGRFVELMQPGIYCDRTGRVCNARHRLTAQVRLGLTLKWSLVVGASDEEIAALDQTRTRRAHQSYNLVGMGERMTHREEAVIRQFVRLSSAQEGEIRGYHQRITPEDLDEVRTGPYSDDLAWSLSAIPPKLGSAPVVAAIAYCRAIAPEAVETFARSFCDARLGVSESTRSRKEPALLLAQWFNTHGGGRAGAAYTDMVLEKTLSALRAHLQNRHVGYLRGDGGSSPLRWLSKQRSTPRA
jgi:hypothetical protein